MTSFQAGENGTLPLTVGPIAPQAPTAEDSPNQSEGSEKFCISCTPIEKWVNLYKLHGAKRLLSRNLVGKQKGFDGEFRLKVLQYKQEHHLSCTQTAMHFCLDVVTVCRWGKKFQKEGAQ